MAVCCSLCFIRVTASISQAQASSSGLVGSPRFAVFPRRGSRQVIRGRGAPKKSYFGFRRLRVVSSHSNPKILKSNLRRYGQPLSPYDSDEDDDGGLDDEKMVGKDDFFSDDELAEHKDYEDDGHLLKVLKVSNGRQGKPSREECGLKPLRKTPIYESRSEKFGSKKGRNLPERINDSTMYSSSSNMKYGNSFHSNGTQKVLDYSAKNSYSRLSEEIDLDERWMPLLDYLSTFGLKESHFLQMYERHMPSLQINVFSARERLEFLMNVGVKRADIKKIILRQPQILEYTVENNLKAHVMFLANLGIPDSRIGQIITSTPSLFSYSVENSLKPTVKYLLEEVGIQKTDLSKVIQLSPQILVQRIDNSWNSRFNFLSKELGAPRDSIVKMVTKHPQILHYSIEEGLLPRINFLRSIGMRNSEILKILTRLTQVFSLSLEGNLKPKYKYLVDELKNEVQSLTKYPMYLSLSLDQRIRPRHRFLIALNKAPKGPFPLSSLVPTDECFCKQWAGTSLDKYLDFRQRLLLKELARKYERR